jgi:hypothetical protein
MVEFGPTFAGALDTNTRAEDPEAREVGFVTIVSLKRCAFSLRVDEPVV